MVCFMGFFFFLADIVPLASCLHDDVMKSILSSYAEPHTLLTSAICRGGPCGSITLYSRKTLCTHLFWVIVNFYNSPTTLLLWTAIKTIQMLNTNHIFMLFLKLFSAPNPPTHPKHTQILCHSETDSYLTFNSPPKSKH